MANNKKIDRKISLVEVSGMLHGVLFGLEKVLLTRFNVNSRIFIPYIIDELEDMLRNLDIVDPEKSLDENIEEIKKYFTNDEVIEGIDIQKLDDNTYCLKIPECKFATSGVHELLEMEQGSCPWSIIIATIITTALKNERTVDVGESTYSEKGSETTLEINSKPEH